MYRRNQPDRHAVAGRIVTIQKTVVILVKLRQQWERYLPFDLGSSPTTAFLSDELTPPIQSGPSGRATRQETVPPPTSDGQVHLAQTYYTIGACGRMARWRYCYTRLAYNWCNLKSGRVCGGRAQ